MQLKLLVFALLWSLTLGCNSSPPRPHRKENCEYCPECARVSTGQIGGVSNFATITNFPWMASFGYQKNGKWAHYCGGAIIFDNILITAAHCFYGPRVNAAIRQVTKVRLGDQNLNDGIDDDNTYEIEKIVPHHSYEGWGPQFDLAMVYLKSKITFNDRIKPICLPTMHYEEANRYANDTVKFSGWGYFDDVSDFSNDLREATFKVLPESECLSTELYQRRKRFKDVFFCAGSENEINWSCSGDSGSPLVKVEHPSSGQPYFKLIGLLHGSKSNCNSRPSTEASMFVNLENSKNFYFIQRSQPVNKFTKLLVVTGDYSGEHSGRKVEVIDLDNPTKTCIMSADFPYELRLAVGGFTSSGPMICSGDYGLGSGGHSADCYSLRRNGQFVKIDDLALDTERQYASSIVTEDGKLIISGGWDWHALADTEIINVKESKVEDGFELPIGMWGHCSVLINSTTVMVLGGTNDGPDDLSNLELRSTYFINLETSQVTKGPDMQEAREFFGCAVLKHNQQSFVIAAGGYDSDGPPKDSTEFLNLEILRWSRGPSLPVVMGWFPLVSTSKGILAVGGSEGYDLTERDKNEIIQLKCPEGQEVSDCYWNELPQKLKFGRSAHVVIPLPASYDLCAT